MLKKTLLIGFSSLALLSIAHANTSSLVVLDTKKTIEDTKPKSPAKIEPKYNITNILNNKETSQDEDVDIYFSADNLTNDASQEVVSASGNVEIIRQDITLKADKVTYDQSSDHIKASGNVVLLEKNLKIIIFQIVY